ncbi:MAG: hypothetical protein II495_03215, partial [Paludibacteraceae bacterium]|nr:hypothetical protein [Paludibacteraceae bacterium]
MMNEGKAKTDFARAVIERAMINGITPAQAAKELMEQRGEARMMAEVRRTIWNDELSLQEKKDILDFIDSLTDEEMKRGYGAMKKNGFIYRFNFAPSREKHLDNLNSGGGFEIIHKVDVSELDEETQNALLK